VSRPIPEASMSGSLGAYHGIPEVNPMAGWIISEDNGSVTIAVQVIPRARRSQVAEPHGDALRVRVAAPPVEGAANEALVAFLANRLGIRKRDIALVTGQHARRKRLRVSGVTAETVRARLLAEDEAPANGE